MKERLLHQFSETEYSVFANNFQMDRSDLFKIGRFTLNIISIRYKQIISHFLPDKLNLIQ